MDCVDENEEINEIDEINLNRSTKPMLEYDNDIKFYSSSLDYEEMNYLYLDFCTFPECEELNVNNKDIKNYYELDKIFIFKDYRSKKILFTYFCFNRKYTTLICKYDIQTTYLICDRYLIFSYLKNEKSLTKIIDISDPNKLFYIVTNYVPPGYFGIETILLKISDFISNKTECKFLKEISLDKCKYLIKESISTINQVVKNSNTKNKLIVTKNGQKYFILNCGNYITISKKIDYEETYGTPLDIIYNVFDFSIKEILLFGKKNNKLIYVIVEFLKNNEFEFKIFYTFIDLITYLNDIFYNYIENSYININ